MNMIENGTLTTEKFKQMQKRIQEKQAEQERQQKISAEKHRLWLIEQSKPKNFIPKQSKYMHVPENLAEFKKLCQSCDLEALKSYTLEIAEGLHKSELATVDATKVVQFLLAQITLRGAKESATAKNEKTKTVKPKPEYSR
jgi:hypothetical protein